VSAQVPKAGARTVVLFDGVCNLCNGFVNFALDRDRTGRLVFGALQSEEAQRLLREAGLAESRPDSLVLIEGDGRAFVRSAAALRAARALDWPWPLLAIGLIVPRPLRDLVYEWVARHRYRWFGQRDSCRMPTPELRARFLEPDTLGQASAAERAMTGSGR
jgi:predicted DCC family thiol-disulfide oxidoreductase YuxK